jgi:hypothetical protein
MAITATARTAPRTGPGAHASKPDRHRLSNQPRSVRAYQPDERHAAIGKVDLCGIHATGVSG